MHRTIKGLLEKLQVKCISCKKGFPYEQIDEHELHCGKCNICQTKLSPTTSIIQHQLNECAKVDFRCVLCMKPYKRDKFRSHKCERLPKEEREMLKKAIMLNRLDDSGAVGDRSPLIGFNKHGSLLDQPRDMAAYEKRWRKKTKGLYLCGLSRWFIIACKITRDKDSEDGPKIF